jgi:hypothetical protein
MELTLYFTEEEIEDFLMKKGFKTFIKTETISHGPYGKQEYDVEVKYVTNLIGTEFTQKEAFDKLLKKRLLEW